MKHIQKLVLIPIERWEKIGDSIPVKEVLVKSVPPKNVQKNISHQKKKKTHLSQVEKVKNQEGLEKTQMFPFLNPEKRKKAVKLFNYIMKYKTFSLTPDGEIIKNGKTLHDSNPCCTKCIIIINIPHSSSSRLMPVLLIAYDKSSKIKPMDPCVPLLVFTPDAGHKEHLSSKMNFDITSFQLHLFNS